MTEARAGIEGWPRPVLFALLCVYLVLLTGVVMFKLPFWSPTGESTQAINLIPLSGAFGDEARLVWEEIAYNVMLFVPLGAYLRMLTPWALHTQILVIAGLSLSFEIAQYIFSLGITDAQDLIDNTLGGIIGIGVAATLEKLFRGRAATIFTGLALLLTALTIAEFGRLFYLSHILMGPPSA